MIFIADILEKKWYMPQGDTSEFLDETVYIGFTHGGSFQNVFFNDLSFGYEIKSTSGESYSESFPKPNVSYLSSSQEILESSVVFQFLPKSKMDIKLWAKNNDEYWEESFTFFGGLPPKPYESWEFNDETGRFEAPIPMPEHGENERPFWDEETQSWTIMSSPNI